MKKQSEDDITPVNKMDALADTKNYAAGEEGEDILDMDDDDDEDITQEEKDLLDNAGAYDEDEEDRRAAQLDNKDRTENH